MTLDILIIGHKMVIFRITHTATTQAEYGNMTILVLHPQIHAYKLHRSIKQIYILICLNKSRFKQAFFVCRPVTVNFIA